MRLLITAAVLAGLPLAACSSSANRPTHQTAAFQYTCCRAADVDRTYRPGNTIVVHWTARPVRIPGTTTAEPVVLTASLAGPFAGAIAAKHSNLAGTLRAAPIHTTDRAGGAPVSELVLPRDTPAGTYNLDTGESADGNSVSGGSIITVAAR